MTTTHENDLRELGFTAAAEQVQKDRELARKLRIAFEHFRVVTPAHIERFQSELKTKTQQADGRNQWGEITTHDRLKLTNIASYAAVPPQEALDELRKAKELNCFDTFEVATIESVRVVPDPIVFGVIHGCTNKYFVCQWDEDVKIEDILRPDEG